MASFEPDEPITSIKVKVHTADVADGGTDGNVFVELFDWPKNIPSPKDIPFMAVLDKPGYNDFERGDKDTYLLPGGYFKGRIVNDIRRVCVHKGPDSVWGGWAFAGITVWINGKELYSSVNPAKPLDVIKWLEDDDRTWRGSFAPIEFIAPSITNLNLPDASGNQDYSVELRAKGGRKPLTWSITSASGSAFSNGPKLVAPKADGTVIKLSGHTASTKTNASWTGTIRVQDADGRTSSRQLTMTLVYELPAPTVTDVSPRFGWPGLAPAEPKPTEVILTGKNFDSRSLSKTRVTFARAGGGVVNGKVLEATGTQLRVEVPAGAAPGQLGVATDFGKTTSPQVFTAHADGYRFRKGFSFRNRTDNGDLTDGFPDTFAWERFEQTFGVNEMWVTFAGQGMVPDPVATANYLLLHDTIGFGCCHGFSLTSLQMAQGIIPTSVYPREGSGAPLEDSLFDLSKRSRPLSGLSKTIQSRQLAMFSDEALSYYLDKFDKIPNVAGHLCQMDARPALEDLKKALQAGLTDPRMLAFAKDCAPWTGHVVVPYALEPLQKLANITVQGIRVYDPNRPAFTEPSGDPAQAAKEKDGIAKSVLSVRTADGGWSYSQSDGDLWHGLYMFTIPLTAYGYLEDWSLPGLSTLGATIGILLGSAGVAGSGQIAQVTDDTGRGLFTADGSTVQDRSQWPANVRPIPLFGPAGTKRHMVVLTKPGPARFTIRPEAPAGGQASEPLLFALRCGGSFTVEQVDSELLVDFDPQEKRLRVAPAKGTASAIVRLIHRFDETAETLGYAFRVADLAPDRPFEVRPAAGGRTVLVTPQGERTIDLEVTHTSRIGEQRILESDGIMLPAEQAARFEVSGPEQLEVEGARPVLLSLEGPDGASRQELGRRILGPVVNAPHRVVVAMPRPAGPAGIPMPRPGKGQGPTHGEPPIAKAAALEQSFPVAPLAAVAAKHEPLFEVPVAVSGLGGPAVRVRPLYHRFGTAGADAAGLKLRMPAGTRPVQFIAEDADGRRSFPRTVFVTVADPGEPVRSPITLSGIDVDAQPGKTVTVPIGVYTVDEKIRGLTLDLSVRRRSGSGPARLAFDSHAFTLSAPLVKAGGTVTAVPGRGQIILGLEASWNPQHAQSGRFDMGNLTLTIPPDMPLGSTFVLEGTGSVILAGGASPQRIPLNVLPVLVRIWGGPEPAKLTIEGPGQVGDEGQAVFTASAPGVPAGASNAGWWVESLGGRASVVPDEQNAQRATLQGERAGWVALHAVIGRTTARHLVRVTPTVKSPPPAAGPKLGPVGRPH